jgi:hypothetical protein
VLLRNGSQSQKYPAIRAYLPAVVPSAKLDSGQRHWMNCKSDSDRRCLRIAGYFRALKFPLPFVLTLEKMGLDEACFISDEFKSVIFSVGNDHRAS